MEEECKHGTDKASAMCARGHNKLAMAKRRVGKAKKCLKEEATEVLTAFKYSEEEWNNFLAKFTKAIVSLAMKYSKYLTALLFL